MIIPYSGKWLRFQHASDPPMAYARVHVLNEYREIISTRYANTYGVFDYERYFGTATKLEVRHDNFIAHFTLPASLPRVVYNDRGELVKIVAPAGSGGRLSLGSLVLIYLGAATLIGFAVFFVKCNLLGNGQRLLHARNYKKPYPAQAENQRWVSLTVLMPV